VLEALIGLALVALFGAAALAARASAEALLVAGLSLAAAGFAFGLPTAAVYHWLLHRALVRAGRLPARWWISPTAHHGLVPPGERRAVVVWAALGGAGFAVVVLGILATALGLWRARTA